MLFSSITFLYYFLPMVVLFYYIVPVKFKNSVLLLSSLVFYAWGEPMYCILMIGLILQGYIIARLIERTSKERTAKRLLLLSIGLSIGSLGYFKYYDFFIDNINGMFHLTIPLLKIALPLGISFYIFQILSYVIDVYWKRVKANQNLFDFMTYATLFPQLVAGPIIRYADVENQLKHRTHSVDKFYCGLGRFILGLSKKVLLANVFGEFCNQFRSTEESSLVFYWLYGLAFSLQIYYDFSGYSDMAIGLGKIFGFEFVENFNYPYISKSITEFWRRWHMTLSSWFRDYVYIPLGGNRVSPKKHIFNIAVVWILTGFWHGASWNFILWGVFYAILLIAEKYCPIRLPRISHFYVILVTILGFVLFNAESLQQAANDILCMFGFGELPISSFETIYYLKSYFVIFVLGILLCTPYVKKGYEHLFGKNIGKVVATYLEPIGLLILLLISTGFLVDGSFNPFLYFRF